jgi:DNA replication protein DnaC
MRDGAILPLLLKELKLPTMLRMWQEIASEAQEKGWSPIRYLASLCEYELSDRERRRLSRRISESQLPRGKSLESYDFACVPSLNRSQIEALATGEVWIKGGRNLLLFGASGVGKTHLSSDIRI